MYNPKIIHSLDATLRWPGVVEHCNVTTGGPERIVVARKKHPPTPGAIHQNEIPIEKLMKKVNLELITNYQISYLWRRLYEQTLSKFKIFENW